jgi:hypothetical protein
MPQTVLLGLMIVAPMVALAALRINAVFVFLSLCLGDVLVKFVAGEANSLVSLLAPHASSASVSTVKLVLLFGPAVITSALMVLSVHGRLRNLLNLLPAAGAAFLGVLLAVPLFTSGLRRALESEAAWQQLSRAQALIVGISAIICVALLLNQRQGHESGRKGRR